MRIALIGDSQSEALWPRVQKAMPDATFVLVRTQRGWSEWHYQKEGLLPQQLQEARPDLVVVELGGNNAFLSEAKYRPGVDWVLKAARDAGATRILYLGPAAATKEPYKSNKVWTRNFQQTYLPQQAGVTWMDSFPATQTGHVDGVHFGGSTYNAWAPLIVSAVRAAETAPAVPQASFAPSPGTLGAVFVGAAFLLVALRQLRRRRKRVS